MTLSLVAGENGILKRATEAVDINEKATAEEEANLLIADIATGYYEEKYVNHQEIDQLIGYIEKELENGKETFSSEYIVMADKNGNVQVSNSEKVISNGTLQPNGKVNWENENSGENVGNTSNLITQAKLTINHVGATNVQLKVETLADEKDSIKEYQVFLNNQLKGTFGESEIEITDLNVNTEYRIFIKIIDKEEKSRISNTEKITTKNATYVYQEGECQDITSGWTLTGHSVSTVSIVDNIIYARRFGQINGGWAISTNQSIDITNYTKLCCKYTAGSLQWNDGLRLRLGKTKYINQTGGLSVASGTYSSESFEYDKTEAIFKWDISQIPQDSYFIGVGGSGATDTYIYSIWLE